MARPRPSRWLAAEPESLTSTDRTHRIEGELTPPQVVPWFPPWHIPHLNTHTHGINKNALKRCPCFFLKEQLPEIRFSRKVSITGIHRCLASVGVFLWWTLRIPVWTLVFISAFKVFPFKKVSRKAVEYTGTLSFPSVGRECFLFSLMHRDLQLQKAYKGLL